MATMKKTNREMFAMLIGVVEYANNITETDRGELIDFINSRIEQIDKKANTVTKADKAKAELNEKIAGEILEAMREIDKPVKVSELIKGAETLSAYSTQKLTPIMTKLVADGKITKTTVKRETLYAIV